MESGGFQFRGVMTKAVINICVQISLWMNVLISLG